jgi:ferrochelatase
VTTGVVLMTYGAPRTEADLPRYLAAVRGGRAPDEDLVAEMRRRYELIGWSPLVRITKEQAQALERELGEGYAVAAGMRFSDPSIAGAVDEVVERGAERVVGVVLSPQWSPLLMSGYVRALADAAAPLPYATSEAWHRELLFVEAVAERLSDALADAGPDAAVLLTAHSLPRRVFDAEPGYVAQLRETAELVAARAGLGPEAWQWAYQSAGHTQEEWLRPDLKELFPALAAAGHREVLVAPVQFVADHLEVLYDLDVAAADDARASGLRYRRVEMPNTNAMFIRALAAVARTSEATIPVAV